MMFLLMSFLHWTQTEAMCSTPEVDIIGPDQVVSVGQGFKLSCVFTCLGVQDVAQLWRNRGYENGLVLINITSKNPNVTLVLATSFSTKTDAGDYSCMTQPPRTISPSVLVRISDADNLRITSTSSPNTTVTPGCCSTQLPSVTAGLKGQMWFWLLLGKSAILLLSFASLASKCKSG